MIKCTKCSLDKDISEFDKKCKVCETYKSICKSCNKIVRKKYQSNNREKINAKQRFYVSNNKDKSIKSTKEWRKKNVELIKERNKKYREVNYEKVCVIKTEWRNKNKEHIKNYSKEYYKKNSEKILKKNREWNKKNHHIVAWRTILKSYFRNVGKKKESKTIELLEYSALDLKNYITSLFTEGMSWDNYGEWHVDHIKPLSSFSEDTPINVVNALSNLQPLWATTREINGVIYIGNLNKHNNYEKNDKFS